jgi:hypothetical protein
MGGDEVGQSKARAHAGRRCGAGGAMTIAKTRKRLRVAMVNVQREIAGNAA